MKVRLFAALALCLVSGSLFANVEYLDEAVFYASEADCVKAEKDMALRIARNTPLDLAGLCLEDAIEKGKFLIFWRGKGTSVLSSVQRFEGHLRESVYSYADRRVLERDGKLGIVALEKKGTRRTEVPYATEEDCTKSATAALAGKPEPMPRKVYCADDEAQKTVVVAADCRKRDGGGWDVRTVMLYYCAKQ